MDRSDVAEPSGAGAFPAPVGRTARRVEWAHLPPGVRAGVEQRIGTDVVAAHSHTSGYTPGLASTLTGADGTLHFVKAASLRAQRAFADSYREEARKLAGLPDGVPAPRLRWTLETEGWVVLGIEHVTARAPRRPWRDVDLDAVLDALDVVGELCTPAPPALGLRTFAEEMASLPASWTHLLATFVLPHGEEAAALAAGFAAVTAGETLVHTDVRDDNVLLADDGRVLLCDWNWPVRGARWLDPLITLVGPRGDGLDVERVLATRPVFAGVDPGAVDTVLALLTGYFLRASDQPVPSYSPHVRDAQRWQGDVCWEWLCERRGWATS